MKKKGQALVEFVLVFPIFLLIVTTIIELGSINYQRYKLEDNLDTVCEMYRKGNDLNNYLKANDLVADIKVNDDEVKIDVSKNVEIITPVLKAIYKNNYKIKTERIFYE